MVTARSVLLMRFFRDDRGSGNSSQSRVFFRETAITGAEAAPDPSSSTPILSKHATLPYPVRRARARPAPDSCRFFIWQNSTLEDGALPRRLSWACQKHPLTKTAHFRLRKTIWGLSGPRRSEPAGVCSGTHLSFCRTFQDRSRKTRLTQVIQESRTAAHS